MRLDPRILLPAALVAGALAIPTATASAQVGPGRCPDNFQAVPTTPATADKDGNHDGWVCAKGPQGANGHFNYTDDKGNPQPGVIYYPLTNTYWNTLTNTEWWATANLEYSVATVQDNTP